jgi:3-oxoacyl-[acyl-carrier protein] reductase
MKTAIITGGSRGLGAATAKRLARDGYNVAIVYTAHKEAAEQLETELQSIGITTLVAQADVGSEESVKSMIASVVDKFGSIDLLVNNAGIVFDVAFDEKTTKQWQRTMDVNLNGVYYCTKHAIPHMNNGGSIVNIASTNGIDTFHPDSIDYDVSKAGVIMFTKAMARDLAPDIRINCVAPGWFDTDINADLPEDYVKSESEKIAMGRFGRPEEIANQVS